MWPWKEHKINPPLLGTTLGMGYVAIATFICWPFIELGLFKEVPQWVKRFEENTAWL